ncbi:cytochrome oxidase putative small subunit CydP [Crenobacter intestini]|nr:cytochrome oxidase putative small subunit CydP [Crenobacter intestini]
MTAIIRQLWRSWQCHPAVFFPYVMQATDSQDRFYAYVVGTLIVKGRCNVAAGKEVSAPATLCRIPFCIAIILNEPRIKHVYWAWSSYQWVAVFFLLCNVHLQGRSVMGYSDRKLRDHLVLVVVAKLLVLVLLWWAFVRDARVEADSASVARVLTGAVSQQGEMNGNR